MLHPRSRTGTVINAINASSMIRYKCIEQDDTVLVVRPPTLWQGSAQLMKVTLWDEVAIGLSPFNCSDYNADFDGDEVQIYPVAPSPRDQSTASWTMPDSGSLGIDKVIQYIPGYDARDHDSHVRTYMMHNTQSVMDILMGEPLTPLAAAVGTKASMSRISSALASADPKPDDEPDMAAMYNPHVSRTKDVMAQHLRQASIGRMTRLARIGTISGGSYVLGTLSVGVQPLTENSMPLQIERLPCPYSGLARIAHSGLPCLRATQALSKAAQQAALDSHKATEFRISRHDMVHSLMTTSDVTVCITTRRPVLNCAWSMGLGDDTYLSVSEASRILLCLNDVVECHHPSVLRRLPYEKARDICFTVLRFICMYYRLRLLCVLAS